MSGHDKRFTIAVTPSALAVVTTLLCDADGTLFPSEEPAYAASAAVTQAFAECYGLTGDFSADHLRRTGTGRNFRSLTADLLAQRSISAPADDVAVWIEREQVAVTAHLAHTLRPDPDVIVVTRELSRRYRMAVVSSSASTRLLTCLRSTGLDRTFPPPVVFSAEDSMPTPIGKPDPAIYRHAMHALDITPSEAVALEDSATGTESAVAAGITTIGVVAFVAPDERAQRVRDLLDAGAVSVVSTWHELGIILLPEQSAASTTQISPTQRRDRASQTQRLNPSLCSCVRHRRTNASDGSS